MTVARQQAVTQPSQRIQGPPASQAPICRQAASTPGEAGQTCDEGQWQPGPLAKKSLEDFIAGRPVTCKHDRYAPEEREAAAARAGVHRHRCVPPWEWWAQQARTGQ